MPSAIKWSALVAGETVITGTAMRSVSDGANKLGVEYDNSTGGNRNMYADFLAKFVFNTAPTAGDFVALYLLSAPDGSSYEYGGDAVDPAPTSWKANFIPRTTTAAHFAVLRHILLPPTKFKILLINEGGSRFSGTAADLFLKMYQYNAEGQ